MQQVAEKHLIWKFQEILLNIILRRIMSRIKDNEDDFINKPIEERQRQKSSDKNVSVSFEYELSNANYNPDGIKDKKCRLNFYEEFRNKLKNITGKTWKELGKENKKTGYESIPYKQFEKNIQASFKNINIISPDSKLDIIRVANDYRVIGKYLNGVYYIIAYDIDFSAYGH